MQQREGHPGTRSAAAAAAAGPEHRGQNARRRRRRAPAQGGTEREGRPTTRISQTPAGANTARLGGATPRRERERKDHRPPMYHQHSAAAISSDVAGTRAYRRRARPPSRRPPWIRTLCGSGHVRRKRVRLPAADPSRLGAGDDGGPSTSGQSVQSERAGCDPTPPPTGGVNEARGVGAAPGLVSERGGYVCLGCDDDPPLPCGGPRTHDPAVATGPSSV